MVNIKISIKNIFKTISFINSYLKIQINDCSFKYANEPIRLKTVTNKN